MILLNCDTDKAILFKYLKKYKFNVMGNIKSINTWSERGENYVMTIKVPMRVGMIDSFGIQNHSIVTSDAYFTINKNDFDIFYNQEIRDSQINNVIKDLDN